MISFDIKSPLFSYKKLSSEIGEFKYSITEFVFLFNLKGFL